MASKNQVIALLCRTNVCCRAQQSLPELIRNIPTLVEYAQRLRPGGSFIHFAVLYLPGSELFAFLAARAIINAFLVADLDGIGGIEALVGEGLSARTEVPAEGFQARSQRGRAHAAGR